MGACYSVTLRVKMKDEAGAINALKELIKNDTRTNYNLEKYAEQGITTETFDDLMRIFLAGWKGQEVQITDSKGYIKYQNEFDASYGWEDVLINMFKSIAPFAADKSRLLVYPDSGYYDLRIKNGECIWVH